MIHGIVKTEGERRKKKEARHCVIKKTWSKKKKYQATWQDFSIAGSQNIAIIN